MERESLREFIKAVRKEMREDENYRNMVIIGHISLVTGIIALIVSVIVLLMK